MVKEIEKKYLLWENGTNYCTHDSLKLYSSIVDLAKDVAANGYDLNQGYFSDLNLGLVLLNTVLRKSIDFEPVEARLRHKSSINGDGSYHNNYYFTLKGPGTLEREEEENPLEKIIFDDYWILTKGKRIIKKRLEKEYQKLTSEIDVFFDRDLVTVEFEAKTPEQIVLLENIIPPGKDITEDYKYKNRNLAK